MAEGGFSLFGTTQVEGGGGLGYIYIRKFCEVNVPNILLPIKWFCGTYITKLYQSILHQQYTGGYVFNLEE